MGNKRSSTALWLWARFHRPRTTCNPEVERESKLDRSVLTFHAIIVRGDDLPRTAAFQPRIGPNLAHLCARLGLVFAESMFAAIHNGDTVSEEMHFGLIEPAIMRSACVLLVRR